MPAQDQLEIISPGGNIEFRDLDPRKGVANIGRHPDNDIIIDSPDVALFHAVLDYSQKPSHITLLNQDGETMLGGQPLSPNIPTELRNWDTIEIAGYTIVLLESMGAAVSPIPVEQPPAPVPASGAPPPQMLPRLPARPPDRSDDAIIIELSEREWTVNVEQTATCQVTITNGGDIVATFVVRVEGVDESWVDVSPPQVNLNEGERTPVTITITPPRLPSSRAGAHHLAIVVTSPNYPGRDSQRGATLVVNPYYEFAVGELSPKQQTVGGRLFGAVATGETVIHVANKGNSEAAFRLEAMDDARALSFEFEVPGEITNLARQAEMRLPPEETFAIPIHITPLSLPLVGLRKRSHPFTVSAAMLEGPLTPRSLLGQVKVRPLIGPWLLALFAILLGTLVILIFQPRITSPLRAHPQDDITDDDIVNPGETVELTWATWPPFTHVRIKAEWLESGVTTPILLESGAHQTVEHPPQDVIYTLMAENSLSDLLPFIKPKEDRLPIDVFPLEPRIIVFNPDAPEIVTGQDVILRWRVENADEVILSYHRSDGNTGEIILDQTEYESGMKQDTPPVPTTYELCVTSKYSEDRPCEERMVTVREPTPTPLPVPIIRSFSVMPREIYAGENVTITWEVEDATSVKIVRDDGTEEEKTALTGETIQTLTQLGVAKYRLIVVFDDGKGRPDGPSTRESDEQIITIREKPTPTPEPQKPVIEDFRVVPSTVVMGNSQSIQLVWSVTGDTTNIEISGPMLNAVSNLARTGSIPVSADTTTFFILTAYNGDLSSSQTVELTVQEPTPTPPPPTPTPTPAPEPVIEYFVAKGAEDPNDVTLLGSGSLTNSLRYEVVAGAKVIFSWSVHNAAQVTLFENSESLGEQPAEWELPPRVIIEAGQYRLVATNADGIERSAFIQITTRQPEPPPSPYNVDGPPLQTIPLTITWSYDADHLNDIIGFRVYRADAPYEHFDRMMDEAQLDNLKRNWGDPSPGCGQAYYVVAVYEVYVDGEKTPFETDPSPDRYYSWPCPTPTP